jgi:hypothetical protein
MSAPDFKPFYQDGTEVMEGDYVLDAGNPRRIGKIFPPDHELSIHIGAKHGCVEFSPSALRYLPLEEDTEFVGRGL